MDVDEEKAKRMAQYTIGQELSDLSIDEIAETIEALEREIIRLKNSQSEKSEHLSAASALFKS